MSIDRIFAEKLKTPEFREWEKQKSDIEVARGFVAAIATVLVALALIGFITSVGIWAFGNDTAALRMLVIPVALFLISLLFFKMHANGAKKIAEHEAKKPQKTNRENGFV